MAQKRISKNKLPLRISPYILGYIVRLEQLRVPIQSVYLFGSWAKGTQHRWSDIDLAIISPQFSSWEKKRKLLAKAMHRDLCEVEPHGFSPQAFADPNNPVVYEIKKYGIRIV